MRARLFSLVAAISATTAVLSAALWVRTFFASDYVYRQTSTADARHDWMLASYEGFLFCCHVRWDHPASGPPTTKWRLVLRCSPVTPPASFAHRSHLWIAFRSPTAAIKDLQGNVLERYDRWDAAVELWFLSALAAIPPGAWLFAWHRRRRARPGCCPACGYDLRATPNPSGRLLDRCPECGTTTSRPPADAINSEAPTK